MSLFTVNRSSKFDHPSLDVTNSKLGVVSLPEHTKAGFKPYKNINVDFVVDGNSWVNLDESYFVINLKLNAGAADATHVHADQVLAYNPGCALFSKISHYIDNNLVCECTEPLLVEAYYYRTTTGQSYRETYMDGLFLSDHAARTIATHGKDRTRIHHEIIYRPVCLPTFTTGYMIPNGSKHRIVLQINPAWKYDVVENNDNIADADYSVEVENLRFEYQLYLGKPAPVAEIHFPIRKYNVEYKELTTTSDQMLQFIIPQNTHRIAVLFQSNDFLYNRIGYSKSDFKCNTDADVAHDANDIHKLVTGFYFRNGDRPQFPNPPAKFDIRDISFSNISNQIYKDTVNALLKSKTFEHIDDWLDSPFYVYALPHADEPLLKNNQLTMQLSMYGGSNTAFAGMRVWLICEYDGVLSLDYAANGLQNVQIE